LLTITGKGNVKNDEAIKNGQWRYWQHGVHRMTTNKAQKHNTTQKTKKMSNADPTKNRRTVFVQQEFFPNHSITCILNNNLYHSLT
jgi:hypothetical protein